jgi:hypothetical protein
MLARATPDLRNKLNESRARTAFSPAFTRDFIFSLTFLGFFFTFSPEKLHLFLMMFS